MAMLGFSADTGSCGDDDISFHITAGHCSTVIKPPFIGFLCVRVFTDQ